MVDFPTCREAHKRLVLEELVENEIAYPDPEFLGSLENMLTLPAETSSVTDALWTDIMATGSDSVIFQGLFLAIAVIVYIVFKIVKNRIKKKRMSYY